MTCPAPRRVPVLGAVARLATLAIGLACLPPAMLAQTPPPARPLNVIATIKPIHALAAAVLGDVARPGLLIDGAASPHTYALKPSQVRGLNAASAVLMVSDDLETFMIKVAASLPKTVRTVRLDSAPGLTRLPVREGGLYEQDDHDHGHAGHDHDHEKKSAAKKSGGPSSPPMDAHLWLDPENGKAILAHLAAVFADLDPAHKATFESNARAAAGRLDQLQKDLVRDLQPVAGKPFLVFHDAYQYFERRFGLTSAGSITVNPEVQPGAKRLKALRDRMEQGGAVCVFAEPQFEPKLVATLINGTKVRKGTLDPVGAALPAGPDAYEGVLRGLAAELRGCLGGTS